MILPSRLTGWAHIYNTVSEKQSIWCQVTWMSHDYLSVCLNIYSRKKVLCYMVLCSVSDKLMNLVNSLILSLLYIPNFTHYVHIICYTLKIAFYCLALHTSFVVACNRFVGNLNVTFFTPAVIINYSMSNILRVLCGFHFIIWLCIYLPQKQCSVTWGHFHS